MLLNFYRYIIFALLIAFTVEVTGQCTFIGKGGNKRWNNPSNWDCGKVPDASCQDIIIPTGKTVKFKGPSLCLENTTVNIYGDVDFGPKAEIQVKKNATFNICGTSTVTAFKLIIEDGGTSSICDGVSLTLYELEVKKGGAIKINTSTPCLTITKSCNLKLNGRVTGKGCVNGERVSSAPILGNRGPGGVGSTDGTGELVLWLDAKTITNVNDGEDINTWADQSGYSNNASTGITYSCESSPNYVASDLNNRPSVYFDADNHEILELPFDESLTPSKSLSVFSVYKPQFNASKNNPSWGGILMIEHDDDWDDGYCFGCRDKRTNDYYFYADNYRDGIEPNDFSTDLSDGSGYVLGMVREFSSGDLHFWQNHGKSVATGNGGNNRERIEYDQNNPLTIGGCSVDPCSNNYVLEGYIPEIILYKTETNKAQSVIINNYLSSKYNIPLIGGDYYKKDKDGFDNDVAGIGQYNRRNKHDDSQGPGIVRVFNPSDLNNKEYLFWGHNGAHMNGQGITDLPPSISSRLAREWSVTETGQVGTVSITIDLSEIQGSLSVDKLRLLIDKDGVYASGATILSAPALVGTHLYKWENVRLCNNDHFTVGSIDIGNPLNINIKKFEVTSTPENQVEINWQLAKGTFIAQFDIEKSSNLTDWHLVNTKKVRDSLTSSLGHKAFDKKPFKGISYYRIKATDYNAKIEYSKIKTVAISETEILKVYPNPTSQNITIVGRNLNSEELLIYNLVKENLTDKAKVIQSEANRIILNIAKFDKGIYFIKINHNIIKIIKK